MKLISLLVYLSKKLVREGDIFMSKKVYHEYRVKVYTTSGETTYVLLSDDNDITDRVRRILDDPDVLTLIETKRVG